jgi:hypothetical protein
LNKYNYNYGKYQDSKPQEIIWRDYRR